MQFLLDGSPLESLEHRPLLVAHLIDSLSFEEMDEIKESPNTRRPSSPNTIPTLQDVTEVESERARIERLGRQRPDKFQSLWEEAGFIYAVVMSQAITEYFVSGFNVLLPTVIKNLDISAYQSTWPASSFSLVVAAFLLPFGRLADMYGGYPIYVAGVLWLALWSVIAGFSQNEFMMDFCRALQGLGPAAYLPSGLMLLGSIYRPGPRKNLIFSLYGAAAPLGFFIGIFFAGIAAEYASWGVYFWIGAGLTASTGAIAYFCIPSDISERKEMGIKMDWPGAIFIPTGLILVVFAITDSTHAPHGWATPYVYFLLVIGVIFLAFAVYVEGWVSKVPLLPPDLFAVKYMKPLVIALLFSYGSLGVFMLYSTLYMTETMGASPMQLVAWFAPMALGGCVISTLGGFVLHVIPGTVLLTVAGVSWIVAPLLFAIAPFGANYWFYTFWSMICATIAIDTTFTVCNVFITTNLPLRHQGLAGALINSILQLGIAFFLSLSEVVAIETRKNGVGSSYKAVFWFEVGMAATALFLLVGFVKMKAAESDLTADEKAALQEAAAAGISSNLRREGLLE